MQNNEAKSNQTVSLVQAQLTHWNDGASESRDRRDRNNRRRQGRGEERRSQGLWLDQTYPKPIEILGFETPIDNYEWSKLAVVE